MPSGFRGFYSYNYIVRQPVLPGAPRGFGPCLMLQKVKFPSVKKNAGRWVVDRSERIYLLLIRGVVHPFLVSGGVLVKMGNFYDDDDREGEDPVIRTQVELTLQNLLQKQLFTFVRLERVEFEGVTQSMLCIGHGFSGVGTLAEFRENELLQKKEYNYTEFMNSLSPSPGFSKDGNKRKRRNCLQEAIIKQGWTLGFTKALHVRNVFVERLTRSAPVQLQKYFPIWLLKQQFSMQTLLDFSHQLAHHLCGYTSGVSCSLEWQLQIYHWS